MPTVLSRLNTTLCHSHELTELGLRVKCSGTGSIAACEAAMRITRSFARAGISRHCAKLTENLDYAASKRAIDMVTRLARAGEIL
jgi:hypothetical protein